MQRAIHQQKHLAILYDADHLPRPTSEWLAPEYWRNSQPMSAGRGASWLVTTPWGQGVLKHFRRGGWMAPLLKDAYFFQSWQQTRSWHEWRVLAALTQQELPVPRPWMAWAVRRGRFYRCGLMTEYLAAHPLSELNDETLLDEALWQAVGTLLQRLCDAGVQHADFNLSNILRTDNGQLYCVDFDRARFQPDRPVNSRVPLQRLLRSYNRLLFKKRQQAGSSAALPYFSDQQIEALIQRGFV